MGENKTEYSAQEFREMMNNTSILNTKGRLTTNHSLNPKVVEGNNKKIKNAKKHIYNGITFDSGLELKMYQKLSMFRVPFVFKRKYVLIEAFKYGNKSYREVTWSPDFVFDDLKIVVDTKGFPDAVFPLKLKLFHRYLNVNNMLGWTVEILSNEAEVDKFILKINP